MSNITTFTLTPDAWLYQADCRDVLRALPENSLDSCVCDPPYHLTSVVKRFGGANAAPAKHGTDGLYARQSRGFMQKTWDGGDIAFDPETWALVLRVLKPGAHLVAFGAPRGYHRMACAIEDAGFEIRDSLMWLFGSGMPKSHSVSLAIDKAAGAVGHLAKSFNMKGGGDRSDEFVENGRDFSIKHVPVTPEAVEWNGWGSALKPAHEPIVLARKPLENGLTIAANVLRWRCGALNIDACRVDGSVRSFKDNRTVKHNDVYGKFNPADYDGSKGRWPANCVTDGSEEVVRMFPQTAGSAATYKRSVKAEGEWLHTKEAGSTQLGYNDGGGSAARFFYSSKANKTDRAGSLHPTIKPVSLMRWLTNLVTPPGGCILDPFAGSGTTGQAALENGFRCVLVERESEYVADIQHRIAQMKKSDVAAPSQETHEQQKASAA